MKNIFYKNEFKIKLTKKSILLIEGKIVSGYSKDEAGLRILLNILKTKLLIRIKGDKNGF